MQAIRETIGPRRFLLGCGGTLLTSGSGLWDGARTGCDVAASWQGILTALSATCRGYFLHNILWYSDPDTLCVREPLTPDEATLWASLMGLSGQVLMVSDRMPDLPADRVELLRRVFPAQDIRPVDLFPLEERPAIWVTRVGTDWGQWDVVGLFNWTEDEQMLTLDLSTLGYDESRRLGAFEFWTRQWHGPLPDHTLKTMVPGHACRVFALRELPADRPVVVSTSRHILQGVPDLQSVAWDASSGTLSGTSCVVPRDDYRIWLWVPKSLTPQQSLRKEQM